MSKDRNTIHVTDTLKSLDEVLVADPRNEGITIADWHATVADILLIQYVPIEVQQLFENAKNIALYAYFAYRLHQSAETIGYTALERALRMKYEGEKNKITVKRTPKSLSDYMDLAMDQGWIKSERYDSFRFLALSRVRQKKICHLIESDRLDLQGSIPLPEPEEHEIIAEMREMDIASRALHGGRHIRNYLAHGDGGLSPSAIFTLKSIAEEINQLFSASE